MSTATLERPKPAIEYPDSDGEPMAENTQQLRRIVTIHGNCSAIFMQTPDVFVAGIARCDPDVCPRAIWYEKVDKNQKRQPDTSDSCKPHEVFAQLKSRQNTATDTKIARRSSR